MAEIKGFALKKQVLLLSVAVTALSAASPAFAQLDPVDDITTTLTAPITTATAGPNGIPADILLDTGGGVTVTVAGPAVTINSNNSFDAVTGSEISNINTTGAVGMLVDLTTQSLDATNDAAGCGSGVTLPCHTTEGIVDAGIMSLSGTGTGKTGLWLEGPTTGTTSNSFTGNIDMTGSTITITGDTSFGVKIDSLAELNGNLTLGQITMKTSSDTSAAGVMGLQLAGTVNGDIIESAGMSITGTPSSPTGSLIGMDLTGTINGNLTINLGSAISVAGIGAEGVLLTGNINACNTAVSASCTSIGSFVNNGSIIVAGKAGTVTATTGNAVASFALGIGGSIAGGIYNAGPSFTGDTTAQGTISTQGISPAIKIAPELEVVSPAVPILIGRYVPANNGIDPDPGFSFYNRGTISSSSSNANDSTQAIFIGGGTNIATTTLTGGLFNAGTIATAATDLTGATPVHATALNIGGYGFIGVTQASDGSFSGDIYTIQTNGAGSYTADYTGDTALKPNLDDQAALVNSGENGSGRIVATVSGAAGGEADAILIAPFANLPSIINGGLISAVSTTTDPTNTDLIARAIVDQSGTLSFIENNGTIAAATTTLNDDSQLAVAIDLSNDTEASTAGKGVLILDQATVNSSAVITGKILFGSGDNQIIDVEGASSDKTATINGDINYGNGSTPGSDQLIIGNFGTVNSTITSIAGIGVDVDIRSGGTLNLQNDTTALNVAGLVDSGTGQQGIALHVEPNGTLNLTVLEEFKSGIINSTGIVLFDTGAKLNITYGSFVPSNSIFTLITAPKNDITVMDIDTYNQQLHDSLPFLFNSAVLTIDQSQATTDALELTVDPKSAGQLGLTGYAAQMLPLANQALSNDDVLGAAFVTGITSQKAAQLAYNEMAPDVSGGARAIAIALTDQSSGPVAARQRMLRMYGKQDGETTLWGEEFAEFVSDPGDKSTGQTGFKDHGFGFVMGIDGGDPKTGWYGGAFSFYSGDIVEPLPRDSHTNTLWYMLTGYTDWRGKGLFLDTKVDLGYMDLKSKRFIDLTIPASGTSSSPTHFVDEADGHRPGLVGALGMTTGAILAYGSTTFTPQLSIDGMSMREEGYTEVHPGPVTNTATGNGKGFDLQTQSYYANSLRAFVGTEVREDLNLGDFFVQPDLRLGYRYDFLNDPTKLRFAFANGNATGTGPGDMTTLVGPDPAQGNFVAGASIAATTDAWTLGANYDFVRGTNGATTQVGTIHLLGRI